MKRQSGSAHIILITVLVAALIGALGFIFWQNFVQKSDSAKNNSATTSDTAKKDEKSTEPTTDTDQIAGKGTIVGSLTYPSEGIPPSVTVYATNIKTNEEFSTGEHLSGSQYKYGVGYKIEVPAGDYYVYAVKAPGSDQRAYYDNFAECGFANYDTCKDAEKKIVVSVQPDQNTKDILVGDWYNPCLIESGKQPTEKFKLPTC